MKLSEKAQAALDRVVQQFQSGDLSPIVQVVRLQLPADCPASQWSLGNRVLAYAQSGSLDCRGYRQWQQAGRQVQQGSRAAYILAPHLITTADAESGEDVSRLVGFLAVPVFPFSTTVGEQEAGVDYAPRLLPPLADVAERLGVAVHWEPLAPDRLGSCATAGDRISVGTHDPAVFFHELAHAAHARLEGRLKGGQDAGQETVAEFTAAVLMALYGLADRSGNAWEYIGRYNSDPLTAITQALAAVERVLGLLESLASTCQP